MTSTYPIRAAAPAPPGVDWPKIVASLEALKVDQEFVIPALELANDEGIWSTSTIGSRIHQCARRRGIKIRTSKVAGEGLRVRRIG